MVGGVSSIQIVLAFFLTLQSPLGLLAGQVQGTGT